MTTARGFLGSGSLYIARYSAGVFLPYEGPFECGKLEIKPSSDKKELTSKARETYGQAIESVIIPKPFEVTVELTEMNKTTLALALFGTAAALAQTAGSLTEEAFVAKKGSWVPLTKAAWTEDPVVTNSAGSTTYVKGVDYLVNRRLGWIKILETSVIAADASLKASVDYDDITGTKISGATNSNVRARFKLDGMNMADSSDVIVTVHEAVIAADSALDFLGDDFATVSLPGTLKTPAGMDGPFDVELRDLQGT